MNIEEFRKSTLEGFEILSKAERHLHISVGLWLIAIVIFILRILHVLSGNHWSGLSWLLIPLIVIFYISSWKKTKKAKKVLNDRQRFIDKHLTELDQFPHIRH